MKYEYNLVYSIVILYVGSAFDSFDYKFAHVNSMQLGAFHVFGNIVEC